MPAEGAFTVQCTALGVNQASSTLSHNCESRVGMRASVLVCQRKGLADFAECSAGGHSHSEKHSQLGKVANVIFFYYIRETERGV